MASFTNNNEQQQQRNETREFVGFFITREGRYGSFHKAIIDGYEYYLTPGNSKKDGSPGLILKKSKTPLEINNT